MRWRVKLWTDDENIWKARTGFTSFGWWYLKGWTLQVPVVCGVPGAVRVLQSLPLGLGLQLLEVALTPLAIGRYVRDVAGAVVQDRAAAERVWGDEEEHRDTYQWNHGMKMRNWSNNRGWTSTVCLNPAAHLLAESCWKASFIKTPVEK